MTRRTSLMAIAEDGDRYLEPSRFDGDGSEKVGLDPRKISKSALRVLTGPGATPLRKIREKCLDCSGGSMAEVRRCTAFRCPLWIYRMGSNPLHARAGGGL